MQNENKLDKLREYRAKLNKLNEEEKKHRDLYLKKLVDGTIQGPLTGYSSIDKQWLKYYDDNSILMPSKKFLSAYEYMKDNNKHNLNRTAISYFNRKYTYEQLLMEIDKVSKSLIKLGIKSGDNVLLVSANTPENTFLFYALNRIGAVSMIIDPRLKKEEIYECIKEAKTKKIFMLNIQGINEKLEYFDNLEEVESIVTYDAFESINGIVKLVSTFKERKRSNYKKEIKWNSFIMNGETINLNSFNFGKNENCVMVRTGGTTGKPKSVVLTNNNMNEMAYQHKIGDYNFEKGDTFLNFLPPFIAYGICAALHMPLCLGLNDILLPTFDAKEFPKLMRKYKPNVVFGGPILYEKMLTSKYTKNLDMSFLKIPVSGGDVMSPELEKKINMFLELHGCKHTVGQGYGMTEISSSGVYSKESAAKSSSVGIPLIRNVVSTFDVDTMVEKNTNEEGEICFQTKTMMSGYLNNPEETSRVIKKHEDGTTWLHTGDIGKLDNDGNVYIKGRIKRMIVSNGSKIFPSVIENIIEKNENVVRSAVVGMSNEKIRKIPVAHIIFKENLTDEEIEMCIFDIIKNIKQELPDFYMPATFIIRNQLPLTSINKVDFKKLEGEIYPLDKLINYKFERVKIK